MSFNPTHDQRLWKACPGREKARMSNTENGKDSIGTSRKLLIRSFLLTASVCILGIISLKIYLGTEHASSLLSSTLTSYLHQPVRVTGLHTRGGSIYLTGVSLGNPPDLPPGNLVEVDSIVIAPDWGALLTGRRSLRLIALEGLRLDLMKSSAGVWNFSKLQRLFSEKKSAGRELFIEQFVVTAGAFQVNGQGAKGISFHLFNLATKGSSNARIRLSFEDPVRNTYTVTGTTRPGPKPAFDLTVAAPSLSLNRLAGLLKLKPGPIPEAGTGSLAGDCGPSGWSSAGHRQTGFQSLSRSFSGRGASRDRQHRCYGGLYYPDG